MKYNFFQNTLLILLNFQLWSDPLWLSVAQQGRRSNIYLLDKYLVWSFLSLHEVWAWSFSTSCIFGTDISNKTSPYFYCCPFMQELQFCVQSFDCSWSRILNPLFQLFMTGLVDVAETTWLSSHLFPLCCYCTVSVSSAALYCIVRLIYFVLYGWDGPSTI